MSKLIAYYRVSTKRQGVSGLGLEGQQTAVAMYAREHGGKITKAYTEVESGKRADRPELAVALAHAKLIGATLVVAKLDRLARNVAFLSAIMESATEFVACDNPHANRVTLHILSAVAEAEAKAISERTKAALGAAKRRGIKLGSARVGHWRGREDRRQAGWRKAVKLAAAQRTQVAKDAYSFLKPTIHRLRDGGMSLKAVANTLNDEGHTTRARKPWTPTAVWRLLRAN
jgi:DNA invertase Pin-like site-specific DNA recombinase